MSREMSLLHHAAERLRLVRKAMRNGGSIQSEQGLVDGIMTLHTSYQSLFSDRRKLDLHLLRKPWEIYLWDR